MLQCFKIFRGSKVIMNICHSGIDDRNSCSIAAYQSLKWQAYRYDAEVNERNAPMTDEDMSVTRVGCLAAEGLFRKPLFHYFPDSSEVEKDKLGCAHAATVTTGGFHSQTFACHCTKWSIDLSWKIVIFQFPLDAHNRSQAICGESF